MIDVENHTVLGLLVAVLLMAASAVHAQVTVYEESFNHYQNEGTIVFAKTEHCDSFLLDRESSTYCDGGGADDRSQYNGFIFSSDGNISIEAECNWDITDPAIGSEATISVRVEGEGSQVVCQTNLHDDMKKDETEHETWSKDVETGSATDRKTTSWLNHTADGIEENMGQVTWHSSWVTGADRSDVGRLQDPSQEDAYRSISNDATTYKLHDPSGDDTLLDTTSADTEQITLPKGETHELGDTEILWEDDGNGGKIWTFRSTDGTPASADLKDPTPNIYADGWASILSEYN